MERKLDLKLIDKARQFAKKAHDSVNQVRKYVNLPYWVHCEEVADLVKDIGGSTDMICAAFLHDTVEDTPTTLFDIAKEFGEEAAILVQMLTNVSKKSDGNRAFRKELDREHLRNASPDAKTIKLADRISNISTIVEYDPKFAQTYLEETLLLLPVLKEGHIVLWKQLENMVKRDLEVLKQQRIEQIEKENIALKELNNNKK